MLISASIGFYAQLLSLCAGSRPGQGKAAVFVPSRSPGLLRRPALATAFRHHAPTAIGEGARPDRSAPLPARQCCSEVEATLLRCRFVPMNVAPGSRGSARGGALRARRWNSIPPPIPAKGSPRDRRPAAGHSPANLPIVRTASRSDRPALHTRASAAEVSTLTIDALSPPAAPCPAPPRRGAQ
jgi:hypothetical protein